MCGPRGLPPGTNILYHNRGDGTFVDVSEKTGILKPGPGTVNLAVVGASWDGLWLTSGFIRHTILRAKQAGNGLATSGGWLTAAGGVRLGKDSE